MIVLLTGELRIRKAGRAGWALERKHIAQGGKTAGQETWIAMGSFTLFDAALTRAHDHYFGQEDLVLPLHHAMQEARRIAEKLSDAAKRFDGENDE